MQKITIQPVSMRFVLILIAIYLGFVAYDASAQTPDGRSFCKNCYVVKDHKGVIVPRPRIVHEYRRCDVKSTGTGAFCTFVDRNIDRAAWQTRRTVDSAIQRRVGKALEKVF